MLDYCHIISLHRGVVVKLHVVLLVMVDTLYADCNCFVSEPAEDPELPGKAVIHSF